MWAAGKRRRYARTGARKITNYRSPKVFSRRFKKEGPKFSFHLSRKAWGNLGIGLLGVIVLYLLFFSSTFRIKDIMVEGAKTVDVKAIKKLVSEGKNIFLFKTEPIKNKAKKEFPQIKDIAFFKGLPNAIKVQIVEKEARLIWQTGGKHYLVDTDGSVGRELKDSELPEVPVVLDNRNRPVSVNNTLVTPDFMAFVIFTNSHLTEYSNLKVTGFAIDETTYDLTVLTDANIKIYLDTTRPVEGQLENLRKILANFRDSVKEYVDLRIDGWGYYK